MRKRRIKVAGGRPRKTIAVEIPTHEKLIELADATGLSMSFLLEVMVEHFEGRWKEAEADSGGERAVATKSLLERLRRTIDTPVKYGSPPPPPSNSGG
jgi:hypothetical protein